MTDHGYVIVVMIAMGLVTFSIRALPFVAAKWLQKHEIVQRLGQTLPLTIMTLLLIHAMVSATQDHNQGIWLELAAVLSVVLIQWFRKNSLLSILIGTTIYVVLRNF